MVGTVREIISDNGPRFEMAYKDISDAWDIKHTSSARYAPFFRCLLAVQMD